MNNLEWMGLTGSDSIRPERNVQHHRKLEEKKKRKKKVPQINVCITHFGKEF